MLTHEQCGFHLHNYAILNPIAQPCSTALHGLKDCFMDQGDQKPLKDIGYSRVIWGTTVRQAALLFMLKGLALQRVGQ